MSRSVLGKSCGKLWSDQRFKSHVDSLRLVNAITAASQKKYRIGRQPEVGEFMAWFLHQLHLGTGGTTATTSKKKKKSKSNKSIIEKIFQGKVRVTTRQAKRKTKKPNDDSQDDRGGSDAEEDEQDIEMKEKSYSDDDKIVIEESTVDSQFLQLTLEIPENKVRRILICQDKSSREPN